MQKNEMWSSSWDETRLQMCEAEQSLMKHATELQKQYSQALQQYECSFDDQAHDIDGWDRRMVDADTEANSIALDQRLLIANALAYRGVIKTLEELQVKSDDEKFIFQSLIKRIHTTRFFGFIETMLGEFLLENDNVRLPPSTHRIVYIARCIIFDLEQSAQERVDDE